MLAVAPRCVSHCSKLTDFLHREHRSQSQRRAGVGEVRDLGGEGGGRRGTLALIDQEKESPTADADGGSMHAGRVGGGGGGGGPGRSAPLAPPLSLKLYVGTSRS